MAIIPNFLLEEFVDNNLFNTAMTNLQTSIYQLAGTSVFFIPGIINPTSLAVTFNGNLTVTFTTNSLECLFSSGAIAGGYGITNGVSSDVYTVNFAGLVPVTGSQLVYIVAQYAQVQEGAIVITGAPVGHPDYSASFTPYVGYTQLQDTLNIFATTTAPNNTTSIEIARTTLTAGQTNITTVDTSHQVDAALNINISSIILVGDVTGPVNNNVVRQSSASTFQVLNNMTVAGNTNTGSLNVPGAAAVNSLSCNTIAAVGSLSVNANATIEGNESILGSETVGVSIAAGTFITAGTHVTATGNINAGANLTAVGIVQGANAAASNQAIMAGQLAGSPFSAGGPNTSGYFTVPIWDGTSVVRALVCTGSAQAGSSTPANTLFTIFYPQAFTSITGYIQVTEIGGVDGHHGWIVNGSQQTYGFQYQVGGAAITGIYWLAIGN